MVGEESVGTEPVAAGAGREPAAKHQREADDLPAAGIFRLCLGLAQGFALYLLYRASEDKTWPATNPFLFTPLIVLSGLIPIFVLQAAGRMSRRTLVIWAIAATAVVGALAWYDRYRAILHPDVMHWDQELNPPSFGLVFFSFVGLFITQSLIAAGDADSSFLTRYRNYFDATWKFGVQLALALAFVGVFWGVLYLGSVLFELIKLTFLSNLIEKSWFAIPATTLAAAAAIHLTDVRARLVAGIRTVALTLLSWLLPLMTLLVGGFVVSLIGTGLDPLWKTKQAAALLLVAAAVLVVLINAAYQDGESENARPVVLRYSELVASALLVPLVALSAYALALRVEQYGWTVERIATLACILVAACYALGYTAAALFSLLGGQWMWALESVNIFVAFLILALLLLLFTPAADPARLSVLSQVSRLEAGTIAPAQFDFNYLRTEGRRYGEKALEDLSKVATGSHAAEIRNDAKLALENALPRGAGPVADIAVNVTVYPPGRALPPSFVHQDWRKVSWATIPPCLLYASRCDAYFVDAYGDGRQEIFVVFGTDVSWWGAVMQLQHDGLWHPVGTVYSPRCGGSLSAMRTGKYAFVPASPLFRDLLVGGQRTTVSAIPSPDAPNCPH